MTQQTPAAPAATAAPAAAPAPVPAPAAVPAPSSWGDPFALGLASFGISALVLATLISGIIDPLATPGVLALAFAMGFLVEMVAGIIHFARGETFPGMVFTAYAGFWLSYGLLIQFFLPAVTDAGGDAAALAGMFLLTWGIFTTYMLLAAMKTNLTTIAIFLLLAGVFYIAAIGSFTGSTATSELAGYVLVVDAALALYASAALVVNGTWERTLLPVS